MSFNYVGLLLYALISNVGLTNSGLERLNIFGFLASGEVEASEDATLNAGFYDQRFALQWVQRNIHQFGGDPTKVAHNPTMSCR